MICNILGCNAEGYVKLMYYYVESESKKVICRDILRVCENHARKITSEGTDVKIQAMA